MALVRQIPSLAAALAFVALMVVGSALIGG